MLIDRGKWDSYAIHCNKKIRTVIVVLFAGILCLDGGRLLWWILGTTVTENRPR